MTVARCPVGVSASGIVIEARVCGSDSVGIVKAVLWQVQGNMARSRSNGEDIMVVRCPVRCLGIVRRDRSCMLEQWATIQRSIAVFHLSWLCLSAGDMLLFPFLGLPFEGAAALRCTVSSVLPGLS
jgi:hypothetical protein